MNAEDAKVIRSLLGERVLSLGVLVDGAPHVGLLPFAVGERAASIVVHASGLARHTRGLARGAPWSALVHGPDAPDRDPLQVARMTLQGEVEPLEPGSPGYDGARARYLARFPDSAQTFALPDFGLYALRIRGGRLVAGFARARDVSPGDLLEVAGA
jgi:hypothetical protein